MFEYFFAAYTAATALLITSHYIEALKLKTTLKITWHLIVALTTCTLYYVKLIDEVSLTLGLSFTAISALISTYTITYTQVHHYPSHLELLMDIFLLSLISSYIAPSFILMVIAWTISEIVGYMLIRIGEEYSTEGSLTSSRGYILTSTMSFELSVFTMITISTLLTAANIGLYELIKPFTQKTITVTTPIIMIPLLMLGFLVKTANIPLHFWLPSAHSSAPSPASASLSGLMVSLGYYGLYRVLEYIDIEQYSTHIALFFIAVGLMSILYGGQQALTQRDVKKLLAYSTIATNGFISTVFAIYITQPTEITKFTLILSILMHAAYKTTLFSEAGLIEAVYGTRYIHGVRGFVNTAPLSTIGGLLSVFSLLGVPGTLGFTVKLLSAYCSLTMMNTHPVITFTTITSILAYIIVSAMIALRYSRIYYDEEPGKIEFMVEKLSKSMQTPVLLMGLLNVLLILTSVTLITYEYWSILALTTLIAVLSVLLSYTHFKTTSTRLKK